LIELFGQLNILVSLPKAKEPLILIEWKVWWTAQPVWTFAEKTLLPLSKLNPVLSTMNCAKQAGSLCHGAWMQAGTPKVPTASLLTSA
jgi:hypothetical protein